MSRHLKIFFCGLALILGSLMWLVLPGHVNAGNTRMYSVSKMMSLRMADGTWQDGMVTVSRESYEVRVIITVSNLTYSTVQVNITDWFRERIIDGMGFGYVCYNLTNPDPNCPNPSWYTMDRFGRYSPYTDAQTTVQPNNTTNPKLGGGTVFASTPIPYANSRYLIYYLQNNATINTFPVNKARTMAFPVTSDSNGTGSQIVEDVGYATFMPKYTSTGMSVDSSSLFGDGGTTDQALTFPGATITLPDNNNQMFTTPGTWLYELTGPSVTADRSAQRTCGGIINPSRSGMCVFNSAATLRVNPQGAGSPFYVSSNPATVQTLPGSAIIGNVRVGGNTNSDVSKILLPGQHLSSGVKGVTSTQNLSYSVDDNTVSALKIDPAADIYGNVFLDANLALIQKNPDYLLGPGNASPMSNNFNTAPNNGFNMTCTPTCSTTATGFSLTPKTTGATRLDLSSMSMTNGASAGTTPTKTNSNGYVWFIDGNLTLTGNGTSFSTIQNLVKGTIVVKGQLVIQNIRIDQYNGATLGFIVLGSGGIIWRTQTSTLPTPPDFALNSVAFFANTSLVGSTNNNNQVLSLLGSIVARNSVNFTGVKPFVSSAGAAASVDAFSLRIQYDANLVDNPPPRMSLIGGLPGFTQGGL